MLPLEPDGPPPAPKEDPMKEKRTAWIIGTGPSLRNIDVSKLKDQATITFNRAYIAFEDWGFDPTYYLSIDSNDLRAIYKDVNNLIENSDIKMFFLAHLTDNVLHGAEHFQDNDKRDDLFLKRDHVYEIHHNARPGFAGTSFDHEKRRLISAHAPNSGVMGLKALWALGYNEIAFVGCDARYRDDEVSNKHITKMGKEYISHADYDINHFRDDYFGKGMRFGKPNEIHIIRMWDLASREINKRDDIKVYSCTENSNLNQFYKYIPFEEFLAGRRE